MDEKQFNQYCASLPAATHVVQWGGADVWKVGGKVFAIGFWGHGKHGGITFKVSDIAWEVLRDVPGLHPAPYFASRGMKWMQQHAEPGLGDDGLKAHLAESHRIVSLGLTKAMRLALGFDAD